MLHLHDFVGRIALVAGLAALSRADGVVYVTDLEIYTLLAPCVATAISYDVLGITYSTSACGDSETAMQSCVCHNSADFKNIYSSISSDVTYSCGSSATDDLWSASKVMDQYCNQGDTTITFSTPTANLVNNYITDLPEMAYLPPCAQSALSQVVMGAGSNRCPEDASLFAPCVCSKSDVVKDISSSIGSSVKYSCSNTEDVAAASTFYDEYCAMNEGTTSFKKPAGPPGHMTYYITALPQFKSLPSCAKSAVSYAIQSQSSWLCGSGPEELASCVCLKQGMSGYVSSALTTEVKWSCDSTATAALSSAVSVWNYYCSAASSKVVATVAESAAPTYSIPESRAGTTGPAETGSSDGSKSDKSNSSDDSSKEKSTSGSSSDDKDDEGGMGIVPIAGGIGAAVVLIGVGLGLFFFWRKKRRQAEMGNKLPSGPEGGDHYQYNGKPELMGSTHLGDGKPANHYQPTGAQELSGGQVAFRPELDGVMKPGMHPGVTELPPNYATPPGYQSQTPPQKGYYTAPPTPYSQHPSPQPGYAPSPVTPHAHEMPGPGVWGQQPPPHPQQQQHPVYEFPALPVPAAQRPGGNMAYQAGPVEAYEMDANVGKWKQ
ncbi:hypothetical protein B0T10DRAFT_144486 [Thelonectria olida]|uniref:Uncharacterized protein n=1 Tax=Thelonectria olida TaxID=1576542 RepID=A0A9P9AL54_9HYPO|nr:hypothetical protein B0T10DRAFT_144486 [Thelonectria olida]